ncbi:MAG: diphthamide synthesis protein [archaeon]
MKKTEIIFAEARRKFSAEEEEDARTAVKNFLKNNPQLKSIGLTASLQYLGLLPVLTEEFEKNRIKVITSKGNLTRHEAQVLGCDVNAAKNIGKKVDIFLLAGSGKFHAVQIADATSKQVFILSGNRIEKLKTEEIEIMKRKRLGAIKNFLAGKEIGIIVSTKPGQENMEEALKIKNILEKKGRKAFLFIADTININELENFLCQSWVNTACPALVLDSAKIVNWNEVSKFIK